MNPMLPRLVTVGAEGRVTLPASMRQVFDLEQGSQLLIEIDPEVGLRLRPVEILPRDPSWLARSDIQEARARIEEDLDSGRVSAMTEDKLRDLVKD